MKIAAIVVVIATFAISFFWFNPISKNVDTVITGVRFRINDNTGGYEVIEITIKGTYKYFLFKNDVSRYVGLFSIEGYDCTFDHQALIMMDPKNFGFSLLNYIDAQMIPPTILGSIACATNGEGFLIRIMEPFDENTMHWSCDSGQVICAPANDRQEADAFLEQSNTWFS